MIGLRRLVVFGSIGLCVCFSISSTAGSSGGRKRQSSRLTEEKTPPVQKPHERSILEFRPRSPRMAEHPMAEPQLAPLPAEPTRELSRNLSDGERQITRLILELFNLDGDRQCSVDEAESIAKRISRQPEEAVPILEQLYEQIAKKEKEDCNPEYLHLLVKDKFNPLKDIPPASFEAQKGFTLEQFRIVEEILAKVTGKADTQAKRDGQLNSPFQP